MGTYNYTFKNTLSKVYFSNLLTNDFLDYPKTSENFFYFYTFESLVVSATPKGTIIVLKAFTSAWDLKIHIESIHKGGQRQRDHKCTKCKMVFFTSGDLKRHVGTVHKCAECGKAFSYPGNLKKHIQTVHEGRRDHKCTECGKAFSSVWSMKIHIQCVHEGRSDYKCTRCNNSFSTSGNLKKHVESICKVQAIDQNGYKKKFQVKSKKLK